ncbi:MerR family transcriptional regulator [Marinomonas sp. THO17]|uniref:MerR family transcriptional regulator n=1 Tax=Marinomonas sp. THO17 TaxID=3149048 RepID=UPI00336C0C10
MRPVDIEMNEADGKPSEKKLQDNKLTEAAASGLFPIRELSQQTGVNSVTLRAWERRYGLLKPKRTTKGHRLYDHSHIVRVEAILKWIQQGVAVSKVRALLDQGNEEDSIAPILSSDSEWQEFRIQLIQAAQMMNETKIEQLYRQVFSQYPADIAIRDWLLPSLERMNKGASLSFVEAVLTACLLDRVSNLKGQQKKAQKSVLILGLSNQKLLWGYLAAAIFLDKGVRCQVVMSCANTFEWSSLVESLEANTILAFCENDLSSRAEDLMVEMAAWQQHTVALGAGFWLATRDSKQVERVKVVSEVWDGVQTCLSLIQ